MSPDQFTVLNRWLQLSQFVVDSVVVFVVVLIVVVVDDIIIAVVIENYNLDFNN